MSKNINVLPLTSGVVARINQLTNERLGTLSERVERAENDPSIRGGFYLMGVLAFAFVMLFFSVINNGTVTRLETMGVEGDMAQSLMMMALYLLGMGALSLIMMFVWMAGCSGITGRMERWFDSIKERQTGEPFDQSAQALSSLRPVNYWYLVMMATGIVFLLGQAYFIMPTVFSLLTGGINDPVVQSLIDGETLFVYVMAGHTLVFVVLQFVALFSLERFVRRTLTSSVSNGRGTVVVAD